MAAAGLDAFVGRWSSRVTSGGYGWWGLVAGVSGNRTRKRVACTSSRHRIRSFEQPFSQRDVSFWYTTARAGCQLDDRGRRAIGKPATARVHFAMLVVMSGLAGVGKTTIARALARATGAVHLRIDSIEQVLRNAGWQVEGEGYDVAYAVAEDNLRLGRIVIADCVNPWALTRGEWRSVAERAGVSAFDVEVVCSDRDEHRRRVESREPDIAGHVLPTWSGVIQRDYRAWDDERLVIDTARSEVEQSVRVILSVLFNDGDGDAL
jgi:predicted kinase